MILAKNLLDVLVEEFINTKLAKLVFAMKLKRHSCSG